MSRIVAITLFLGLLMAALALSGVIDYAPPMANEVSDRDLVLVSIYTVCIVVWAIDRSARLYMRELQRDEIAVLPTRALVARLRIHRSRVLWRRSVIFLLAPAVYFVECSGVSLASGEVPLGLVATFFASPLLLLAHVGTVDALTIWHKGSRNAVRCLAVITAVSLAGYIGTALFVSVVDAGLITLNCVLLILAYPLWAAIRDMVGFMISNELDEGLIGF